MKFFKQLFESDIFGAFLLFMAGILALFMSNTPLSTLYDHLIHLKLPINLFGFSFEQSILHWINDGLMAGFFLLVGLEIKREICTGVLSDKSALRLPIISAIGGLIFPAIIYTYFTSSDPIALQGWAIPAATDIAFSLGILNLLGRCVPVSLKIFLMALAIIDDIGAVLIIALFYTGQLSLLSLCIAGSLIVILFLMNLAGIKTITWYFVVGFLLWISVLQSGIHATLAGIILAMAIPMQGKTPKDISPLIRVEKELFPVVTYFVLPLFAFANSGISFYGMNLSMVLNPITLGISIGLFLGKQIGIFTTAWLTVTLGFATLPKKLNWGHLYGVSVLCGVGFTMSLFIGALAFEQQAADYARITRLGILLGSTASGLLGYMLLRYFCVKR